MRPLAPLTSPGIAVASERQNSMVNLVDYLTPLCKISAMDDVRALDEDLWVIDHPFRMPGGIELGARTTLIRLSDGGLWLHSPGPLSPAARGWLEENGPVTAIVAPNLLHHLFLPEAIAAFPKASVYGPDGLQQKLGAKLAGTTVHTIDPAAHPWPGDLECLRVDGCPAMKEFVFLHGKTRTLILTDLAFNVRSADSFVTRVFLRINNAFGKFGPSRLARTVFFKDKAQVRSAIERILNWDFDRIVVSHGDVLESDGPATLRASYTWLLGR